MHLAETSKDTAFAGFRRTVCLTFASISAAISISILPILPWPFSALALCVLCAVCWPIAPVCPFAPLAVVESKHKLVLNYAGTESNSIETIDAMCEELRFQFQIRLRFNFDSPLPSPYVLPKRLTSWGYCDCTRLCKKDHRCCLCCFCYYWVCNLRSQVEHTHIVKIWANN